MKKEKEGISGKRFVTWARYFFTKEATFACKGMRIQKDQAEFVLLFSSFERGGEVWAQAPWCDIKNVLNTLTEFSKQHLSTYIRINNTQVHDHLASESQFRMQKKTDLCSHQILVSKHLPGE